MECPSCKSEMPDGSRFCDVCGAALPACCPSCGAANRAGARFCSKCGKALALEGGAAPEKPASVSIPATASAERRQLTVMFCDLVGSTALSARLDPEDTREIIGAYHRCCAEQITTAGGFVAKYMGDGVLAYFGYPQAHEDDAERAVRSALSLIEAVPSLRTAHDVAIEVRIGIATGVVVVGDLIGGGAAQEHGVVGETPNVAARLQALAEPGQVVISQSTRRLTGGMFEYQDLGRVTLKGLAEPTQAWQVIGTSRVESRFEAQHEVNLTPLVGREEELELLLRRWRQAASGEGRVVLLSGEPGIGKSRLTVALSERLQDELHTRVRYFCSPRHTDSALHPSITQLERASGFERDDTPEAKLAKMTSLLGRSSGHENDSQLLAELLSIPTGGRYAPLDWSPQRKKEKTFEALLRQLEMLSRQRPVLVVYEDVHWIDPSSRELLDMSVERVASLPVLLVITFRPEFQPPWSGQAHVSTLTLSRFGRGEGTVLVERVAGNNALPDEIMAEIVERTDGIPLFVEELTKAVVEAGARDEDVASTLNKAPLSASAVPATLHASLMARLDRLGPVAKEVAQIGAAIGREFSYDVLAPIAQKSDVEVQTGLSRLTEAGLVFCRGTPPEASFLFKHALVRDVAYGSLLRGQRQQLHARIVATLLRQATDVADQQPEVLAQHCTEAELNDQAVVYWSKAARQSVARYSMIEAVAQARKGLDVLARLPDGRPRWQQELELQSALGVALNVSVGAATAETGQVYVRARALCERLGDTATLVQVVSGLATHYAQRCELAAYQQTAVDLLRLADREDDLDCRLCGHRIMGSGLYWLGDVSSSRQHLERALSLYRPEAHQPMISVIGYDLRATATSYLSDVLFILGYPDQAQERSREALSWARKLRNHPHVLVHALSNAATYNVGRRDDVAALELLREAMALATEQGFRFWLAFTRMMHCCALARRGKSAPDVAFLRKSIADYTVIGGALYRPFVVGQVAEICGSIGHLDEALDLIAEALELVETTSERHREAELCRLKGDLLIAHRPAEWGGAEVSLHRALAVARRQNAKMYELRASISLARLWRDQGKRTEARDLLAPIYGWFTEGFDTPDLKEAKALLEELG
jgi:class 3 adenylate cyclase/predicted ATPase